MKVSDVLDLLHAGYSKEDIEAMEGFTSEEVTVTVQETPEEKPEEKPAPAPAPQPEPARDERYDELLAAFQKLTNTIQASNILNDENKVVRPQTADEVIAQFLAPDPTKRG